MRSFFAKFTTGNRNGKIPETVSSIFQNDLAEDDEFFRATTSGLSGSEWNAEFASEPVEWENNFLKCWKQLKIIICAKSHRNNDFETFKEIKLLLHKMCRYLTMEISSQPEPIIGPILEHCFNESIFWHLHQWATKASLALIPRLQVLLLETYEYLIDGAQSNSHYLLVHKPILIPLLRLLSWCHQTSKERRAPASEVDKYFVRLLNQICKKISEEANLLELFFKSQISSGCGTFHEELDECHKSAANFRPESHAPIMAASGDFSSGAEGPFLVFSLLISYMYAAGDVGQLARDALLHIMCVSRRVDYVSKHVAESEFCAVLATGLSGFWSQLPKCICTALYVVDVDEFHKLNTQTDLDGSVPELVEFHKALLFCNAVVQDAHPEITRQIIHYFYDGFLCKVVKAAIEQLDNDELVSIIVYFHLCLETITEESLIQALLKVLIVVDTSSRDMNLLEVILSRMNDNEKLCRAVLSFLRTLLELRCEDLMWNCLLRFILPFIPLKATRRFDVNISLNAADHFLSCIPQCAKNIPELIYDDTFEAYLRQASKDVQEATESCRNWAFKYDGIKPNSLLNMSAPEELLSTRQPFIRLSSARSSFASNGLNRYFQNRFTHGTQDSLLATSDYSSAAANGGVLSTNADLPPLNKLGEDDSRDTYCYDKLDSLLDGGSAGGMDDFADFNLQYEMSDNVHLDYFHFTYEGISSESDETNNSRRNSTSDDGTLALRNGFFQATDDTSSHLVTQTTFGRAVLTTNWSAVTRNIDDFYKALETLPKPTLPHTITRFGGNSKLMFNTSRTPSTMFNGYANDYYTTNAISKSITPSVDENIALIEARFQYLKEVSAELVELDKDYSAAAACNPLSVNFNVGDNSIIQQSTSSGFASGGDSASHTTTAFGGICPLSSSASLSLSRPTSGLLLTCTDEKGSGLFLESLFSALEKLVDRNFTTNLQLIGVLNVLMSYPQPIITSYLLYVDAIKSNALFRITNILETLKVRIDAYASSTDGFENMIRRGVQHKIIRAKRFEKSGWITPNTSQNRLSSLAVECTGSLNTTFGGSSPQNLLRRKRIPSSARMSNGTMPMAGNASLPNSTRLFRHKTVESQEHSADVSRSRNFAYAAILLSQLCQICAAFALQHNTPPLFNQSSNGPPSSSSADNQLRMSSDRETVRTLLHERFDKASSAARQINDIFGCKVISELQTQKWFKMFSRRTDASASNTETVLEHPSVWIIAPGVLGTSAKVAVEQMKAAGTRKRLKFISKSTLQ